MRVKVATHIDVTQSDMGHDGPNGIPPLPIDHLHLPIVVGISFAFL